jgi:serine/threonine protein phosphatase PrpC
LKKAKYPGLAMSRSLGDTVAHSIGCSCEPDITHTILGFKDKVVVVASDGVWEFLSNEEVADLVLPFYFKNDPESAADAVVQASFHQWRLET